LGGGDRDDAGRTEEAVAELEAATALVKDGAFRLAGSGFLSEGLVEMGVKRFSHGVDRGDAVVGQKALELALDQFQTGDDGGDILGGGGGLQAEFKVVEQGEKIRKDRLVGIFEGVLLFADKALAGIFEISADAKELVFEGGDFCGRILLVARSTRRGRRGRLAVWKNDLGFLGRRVTRVLGVLGFHAFRFKKVIRIRCISYFPEGGCQQDAKRPVGLGLR